MVAERVFKKQKLDEESRAEIVAEEAEEKLRLHPHPVAPDVLVHHDAGEFSGMVRHKTDSQQAVKLETADINPFTGCLLYTSRCV